MLKNKKRLSITPNGETIVNLVESQADSVQQIQYPQKKKRNNEKIVSSNKKNLYQKIREIPEIELTLAQMQSDPTQLVAKLQQYYRNYGAVKLKACPEWNPRFCFKYSEKGITTRIQKLHKLKKGKVRKIIENDSFLLSFYYFIVYYIQAFEQKIEEYSISAFRFFAQNFQKTYKNKFALTGSTPEAQKQYQFWQIIKGVEADDDKPNKYKTTVQYAADLPSQKYGSGFPTSDIKRHSDEHFNYSNSFYNLNNTYKSPGSILKIADKNKQKISGVTTPWIYMGMLFASFCWHVEDLWLNSINYNHIGATKIWYVIPESDKQKFDEYIFKKTGSKHLLDSINFMVDPLELIQQGIKVYKAHQKPRQYILTLVKSYHCGFSLGFNVGEAVNIAYFKSLAIIRQAMKYYSQNRKNKASVLCYDWLISSNYNYNSSKCKAYQTEYQKLTSNEYERMKYVLQKFKIKEIIYLEEHVKYDKMICHNCKNYQFLSSLSCFQCKRKYCLTDIVQCCKKEFLFYTRKQDHLRKRTINLVLQKIIK